MNTEIIGLCDRIKICAAMVGSGDALSKASGIPRRTLENYLSGRSEPKASALFAIAKSAGVSIDWLIAGYEAENAGMPSAAPIVSQPTVSVPDAIQRQPLDEDLHASIADGISKAYRDVNARLSPADLGRLSARMHGELIDLYDDPAERSIGLKALLRQLQRDLQAPPGKSDKRSA
ncbi:helix-turn-helix domain-containing protein [Insolitispirillum peregrinum]|uniref:helix-turn-helix domain-containing protein n=1 Tax=Insolitispirillum peregrinum TaxID=80876 RepID=UPI003621C2EF